MLTRSCSGSCAVGEVKPSDLKALTRSVSATCAVVEAKPSGLNVFAGVVLCDVEEDKPCGLKPSVVHVRLFRFSAGGDGSELVCRASPAAWLYGSV